MKPSKLSSQVFLELPPILAHYLEASRNLWIEGMPGRGRLTLLNRSGVFTETEALAVERRHFLDILGFDRARALAFRIGFEQGRREAARHYALLGQNARLALQAGQVFGQLQGRFVAEPVRFEFDLDARTLYREIILHSSFEAAAHRLVMEGCEYPACWSAAGYISGHTSEIVGRRVLTLETECAARVGERACRFISRLDPEWGEEANWVRESIQMRAVPQELAERDDQVANAQRAARSLQGSLNDLRRRLRSDLMLESMVAEDSAMVSVVHRAHQAMASDAPVLLVGEPGSGRETLARAIHYGGARKNKPFVLVDCAGLPENLLAQELFGYAKGALPGALRPYTGALVRAHGGTVYLNELTRLPPEMQTRLLQTLREGIVVPPGAESPTKADVRIIAATQFAPQDRVAAGHLREEIYYALAVITVYIPPLRERGTDILRLAEAFLKEFCERYDRPGLTLSTECKQALLRCAWPGNVRQLRSVMEHAVVLSSDLTLNVGALPEEVLATPWARVPRELTRETIRAALSRTRGNRSRAAELLGIGRTTLWRAMKRMGLD